MRFRASELAAEVGGRLSGPDVEITGAAIDSRVVVSGQLFVPVVGERDGHDFVSDALAAGAAAYFSQHGALVPHGTGPADGTCIEVSDTRAALLAAGRAARRRLPDRIVGVTGSVGKTTVKDLAAGAFSRRFRTAASEKSFNNELGVPLTLLNAADDTEALVVEMGARGLGHVAVLCEVAVPTIGVVTRVAAAHTELFGSLDAVAEAKGELVESLPSHGTAVLNAADHRVLAMRRRTSARCLTFYAPLPSGTAPTAGTPRTAGTVGPAADLVAEDVEVDEELRPSFRLLSPWGAAEVRLAVRGEHNVANALAAAGAALASGVNLDEVAEGLAAAIGSPSRMALHRTSSGLLVLDDAYNANPASMEAALRSLARLPARRRLAVLGVMAELGPEGPAEHRRLADLARSLGIDVLAVGAPDYGTDRVLPDAAAAAAALEELGPLGAGDAVLIKASRVAGLDSVAAWLRDEDGQPLTRTG